MKAFGIVVALTLVGCSNGHAAADRYGELLNCEMRTIVVTSVSTSLNDTERAQLREKLESLSKSVLTEAASLKKTTADLAEDQKRILKEIQGRMQGESADAEARKLLDEAKTCGH